MFLRLSTGYIPLTSLFKRKNIDIHSQEPYTRINGVVAFVQEKTKVIEQGELQIIENKYNKEAKNRVQYFGTLKQVANDNVQKEQWDQALDKVEAARQVVSDLNEVLILF